MKTLSFQRMRGWAFLVCGLLVLGWVGLVLGIPWGLRYVLEEKVAAQIGQSVSVGKIRFSPLRFSLDIQDLYLGDPEKPGMHLGRLAVNVGIWRSLFSWQLVISGLDIERPFVHVRMDGAGELEVGGIGIRAGEGEENEGEGAEASEGEKEEGLFPFLIQRLDLTEGRIFFQDAGRSFTEELTDMRLRGLLLDTKPGRRGRLWGGWRVQSGGTFSLDLGLGLNPLFIRGHAGVGGLGLPVFTPYIPDLFHGKLASGLFSMGMDILFEDYIFSVPHLKGHVSDLRIRHTDDQPFLDMKTLRFSGGPLAPLAQVYQMETIRCEEPRVYLERTVEGIRLPLVLDAGTPEVGDGGGVAEAAPSLVLEEGGRSEIFWALNRLILENGQISWTDPFTRDGQNQAFSGNVKDFRLEAQGFSAEAGKRGRILGAFAMQSGGRFAWDLALGLDPLFVQGRTQVQELFLPVFSPYFPESFEGHLDSGFFSLTGEILMEGDAFSIPKLEAGLSELTLLQAEGQPFFRMDHLLFSGGPLEPEKRIFHVEKIHLKNPALHVERFSHGIRLPFAMEKETLEPGGAGAGPETSAKDSEEDLPVLGLDLRHFALSGGKIHYTDHVLKTPASLVLEDLDFDLQDVVLPGEGVMPWHVSMAVNQEGRLRGAGTVTLNPVSLSADVLLEKLGLKAFSPYLETYAGVVASRGQARFSGKLDWDENQGFRMTAAAGLGDLVVSRKKEREPFLRVDHLEVLGVRFGENPPTLCMEDGLLRGAKIRVDRDAEGMRPFWVAEGSEKTEPEKEGAGPKERAEDPKDAFIFCLQNFRMADNVFHFYDRAVSPVFHTEISDIRGALQGLDTGNPERVFILDMKALKDGQSPVSLNLRGKMADVFGATTLALNLDDFELPSLSPYSRTHVARPLERGKMRMRLDWRVQDSRLDMTNHLRIEGLRLGARVPDSDAPNLPLGLAQALLEDRHGVIQIDLPVAGRVDDPQFRIGPTLWRAFTGLVVRMAASPFTALSGIGSGAARSEVLFEPGSVQLDAQNRETLRVLGQSLRDRPRLQLEIGPVTGPEDTEALAAEQLEAEITAHMVKGMHREKIIELLYQDKTGEKPESLDSAMEILRAMEPVDAGVRMRLGRERAQLVRKVLSEEEGVEGARLFIREAGIHGSPSVQFSLGIR
jgi:hypothetical protein